MKSLGSLQFAHRETDSAQPWREGRKISRAEGRLGFFLFFFGTAPRLGRCVRAGSALPEVAPRSVLLTSPTRHSGCTLHQLSRKRFCGQSCSECKTKRAGEIKLNAVSSQNESETARVPVAAVQRLQTSADEERQVGL